MAPAKPRYFSALTLADPEWAYARNSSVSDKLAGWSGAYSETELWRHGLRRDAMLGPDWFKGRRVTIDWVKQDLVFEEND